MRTVITTKFRHAKHWHQCLVRSIQIERNDMELVLQHQRSNFSQFSDSMWMQATNGDTTIKFDVDQRDMIEFALHLCDIADDCLRAVKIDTDDAQEKLSEAVEAISSANTKHTQH